MLKNMRVIALAAIVMIFSTATLWAQGESGAASLTIQPSARANGLGQTYVAIADDATGIWWNPAGLAFVNVAVDLMHSQLFPDITDVFYEYVGGAFNVEGLGTIGGSLIYLTYGDWEATDTEGHSLGMATSWEVTPTLSGAVKILNNIGVGMNLKFIYISLAPAGKTQDKQPGRGHSVAVDIGGLWKVPEFTVAGYRVSLLNVGLCVSNLGPAISFINVDQPAPLPRNLRVGFAYSPFASDVGRLTVAADLNKPLVVWARSNMYDFGMEFVYIDLISIRAGYVHDRSGSIKGPTYGLGFAFNKRYRLDWASIPQNEDLPRVHRWSIGVTF